MWRYLAGGVAALMMAAAGLMLFRGMAHTDPLLPAAPAALMQAGTAADTALPDTAPAASDRTREQKRFDRYDHDRDGKVTRDEYLAARHKAFTKLDTDHDGRLSFDEWAIKAETKFAGADADKSGAMNPAEFAATAVKRKAARRSPCPPAQRQPAAEKAAATEDEG